FAQAFHLAQVGAVQLRVVRELARPVYARVKGLLAPTVIVTTMMLEEPVAAFGQRHSTVSAVQLHRLDQALVPKVPDIRIARVGALVATTPEVTVGNDPKGADSRHRSAVVAVQFVTLVAIEHDFAIETARQLE